MALTKEDIDAVITQTENQDAIRHSLSNYFEGLDKPVAAAIGVQANKPFNGNINEPIDKMVDLLRKHGVDAVSFIDPQAARTDKFVVEPSGVLCPFMKPEDSLKAVTFIEDVLLNDGFLIVGHANPQMQENLLYAANHEVKNSREHGIDLKDQHPDPLRFQEIEQRNGGDYKSFIDRKINEAYADAEDVNFHAMDISNIYGNGMSDLFRGGTLGASPYATVSQWNSRKVAHSSPNITVSAEYSGKGNNSSTRGGAVHEKTKSGLEYGFIYKFASMGDEQKFYQNLGIELGSKSFAKKEIDVFDLDLPEAAINEQLYETPILPHHNKLEAIYVYVGYPAPHMDEAKIYSIPLDENGKIANSEWRDFMALHEPTDDKVLGYVKDRQNMQKKEQELNPNHAYTFELKQGLEADNQEYLNNMSAKEFLRNFMHDGDIKETENGLQASEDLLYIHRLLLNRIPDLSSVNVVGFFHIKDSNIPEIDAAKLPTTTQGILLDNINVKNVSAVSAERFLQIIGAEAKQEYNGYINTNSLQSSMQCDGMPVGWDKIKFVELPPGINIPYDTIDKVPETLKGIVLNKLIIKDQSSIENMSAADFIYKIKGNLGTDTANSVALLAQGVKHTELHDDIELGLHNTNIVKLPSEMKNMTVKSISLNPTEKVTSLDNFPVTKSGISGLNFEGDLKNITMESFLLKTKGQEWVAQNTSKAPDGHLVINNNFDFRSQGNSQMNITSFPKDICAVEFKGNIYQGDVARTIEDLKIIEQTKNLEDSVIALDGINLDLSKHPTKGLGIERCTHSIVLPQNLESLRVCNSQSFDMSNLQQIPQSLQSLSLNNVVVNGAVDLSKYESVRLQNVDLSGATVIPPQQGRVYIGENVKFAPDYKLDLSRCEQGNIDPSVQCAELKLPQKLTSYNSGNVRLPQCVKEITTSCIDSCGVGKFNIPPHVKIVDAKDENGKKVPLKRLKAKGLSTKEISELRKERILAPVKKLVAKVMPSKTTKNSSKQAKPKVDIVQQDKERLASLSGRDTVKRHAVQSNAMTVQPQVQQPAQPQVPPQTQQPQVAVKQAPEAVKDMSKKEKGRFFHKLRMGINTLLTKAETQFVRTKEAPQIQKTDINVQAAIKNKGRE